MSERGSATVVDAMERLARFQRLLREFEKRTRAASERTFLELGGFPHYERVISNFLAFYLNPGAEHKMGNMLQRALLNLLGIADVQLDVVETEAANIDIVASGPTHVVAIENKIYHHADANPFGTYVEVIRRRFPQHSRHFVVLTPFPAVLAGQRHALAELGYAIITYDALFTEIRSIMGEYAAGAANRYWLLFIDLIKTIENISMGSKFDRASLAFFDDNAPTLAELMREIQALRAELRAKLNALWELLKTEHPLLLDDENVVNRGAYHRENDDLFFDTFYVDIAFPNGARVACDVTVHIDKWNIHVIPRNGANFRALEDVLKRADLSFDIADDRFLLTGLQLPQGLDGDIGMVATVAAKVIEGLKVQARCANSAAWVA